MSVSHDGNAAKRTIRTLRRPGLSPAVNSQHLARHKIAERPGKHLDDASDFIDHRDATQGFHPLPADLRGPHVFQDTDRFSYRREQCC